MRKKVVRIQYSEGWIQNEKGEYWKIGIIPFGSGINVSDL